MGKILLGHFWHTIFCPPPPSNTFLGSTWKESGVGLSQKDPPGARASVPPPALARAFGGLLVRPVIQPRVAPRRPLRHILGRSLGPQGSCWLAQAVPWRADSRHRRLVGPGLGARRYGEHRPSSLAGPRSLWLVGVLLGEGRPSGQVPGAVA